MYVSVSVVCCHIEVSVTGRSLVQRNSTMCACVRACVCVCPMSVIVTPIGEGHYPESG